MHTEIMFSTLSQHRRRLQTRLETAGLMALEQQATMQSSQFPPGWLPCTPSELLFQPSPSRSPPPPGPLPPLVASSCSLTLSPSMVFTLSSLQPEDLGLVFCFQFVGYDCGCIHLFLFAVNVQCCVEYVGQEASTKPLACATTVGPSLCATLQLEPVA